ncbi:MAG: DotI/IcmL/TraM family protein [Legionellales bacterium]|nr:DotI/IcmL/TraM family protein [Legionellales bacterium]
MAKTNPSTQTTKQEKIGNLYRYYQQRLFLRGLIGGLLTVLILALILLYHVTHQSLAPSYALMYDQTSRKTQSVELTELLKPNQSNPTVLKWAIDKVIRAYSLNFANYQSQLDDIKTSFTDRGWTSFLDQLTNAGVLGQIEDKKLVLSAVVSGVPILDMREYTDGQYTWHVQMPILVTITSASETRVASYLVSLLIIQVSTLENPKGIEISRFISTSNT